MAIIPSIIKWLYNKRLEEINLFRKYPYETQEEILFSLLARAAETEWGKKYDFRSIEKVNDYSNRLPVQTYDDLAPTIKRLRNGENQYIVARRCQVVR
jgi:hypothetical protein